jgi:catechol 2,3-dioxygenase-like lactoylglutathione lyase family enzyme
MIDHAGINVSDWAKAQAFYDAAFAPLGAKLLYMVPEQYTGGVKVGGYGREKLAARECRHGPGPALCLRRPQPRRGRRFPRGGACSRRQGQRRAGHPGALPP